MKLKKQYYNANEQQVNKIQEEYGLNWLLATVLSNRNIEVEDLKKYLKPTRKDFYNPFEMPDMERAVNRILEAIEKKENITIYGDYDVDGITSTTILTRFFQDLGVEVKQYIPNRLTEGYGLNKKSIEQIASTGCNLMITVDCGISSKEEIEYAKEFKIETIVTDHHEPGNELPNAVAVVDCKRKDNKYQFRELAGVGVAFKICQALSETLNLDEKAYLKYLDIVAIGTIADVVPLVDENRVIAKLGLLLLNQTKNNGLKALIGISGFSKIDSVTVGFGIAPRLNAAGRMGKAYEALNLLLSDKLEEAKIQAKAISEYNTQRQEYEKLILEDVLNQIEKKHLEKYNSIVLGGKGWHHGVVGIVASKIVDLYYKPCLLICFENDENIGKGSGRSIEGFNLFEALTKCKNILESFGGHSMAVGLSVSEKNLNKLQTKFEYIAKKSDISNFSPTINIDCKVNINEISLNDVKSLELLEPFGADNSKPIFEFNQLKIVNMRTLKEGKHVKLSLKTENNTFIDAIGFNMTELASKYKIGDKINIIGNLEINTYNGISSTQIKIIDIGDGP